MKHGVDENINICSKMPHKEVTKPTGKQVIMFIYGYSVFLTGCSQHLNTHSEIMSMILHKLEIINLTGARTHKITVTVMIVIVIVIHTTIIMTKHGNTFSLTL